MSTRAKLSPRARRDLETIHSFISSRNSQAADLLFDEILATADFLAENPEAGNRVQDAPPRHADTRWFPVPRFRSYLIFYQTFQETIMVLRILHAARDWTRFFPKNP
jgi:plasmid stabilization system protein ParE